MAKKRLSHASARRIDAGKITRLVFTDDVWCFSFKNNMVLECYAGWRLELVARGFKVVLKSSDLEQSNDPYGDVMLILGDYDARIIGFNNLKNTTHLSFLHEENDMSLDRFNLQMLSNSEKSVNWKIIGEDFVDTDKKGIIKNL